jgi:glycine hydroxymethyltransferase
LGLNIHHFDIDQNGQIDIKKAQEKILEIKPKFIILSGSVILFPMPIKELKQACDKVGAKIVYDAAHVFGLIFAGYFQNPLQEGADIIVASTHKTFPGPQGGIIIGNINEDLQKAIARKIFPGITSNHHLYRIPGLYVAFCEMKKYGKQYMGQTIKNAQALANALEKNGFDVCYKEKNFTASHQVLVNVANYEGGTNVAKKLEDANIIVNKNIILGDKSGLNPSGIRIGVQEMTRLGMREKEMKQIANLFKQLLIDKVEISKVKKQVVAFRKKYQKVKFSL